MARSCGSETPKPWRELDGLSWAGCYTWPKATPAPESATLWLLLVLNLIIFLSFLILIEYASFSSSLLPFFFSFFVVRIVFTYNWNVFIGSCSYFGGGFLSSSTFFSYWGFKATTSSTSEVVLSFDWLVNWLLSLRRVDAWLTPSLDLGFDWL